MINLEKLKADFKKSKEQNMVTWTMQIMILTGPLTKKIWMK